MVTPSSWGSIIAIRAAAGRSRALAAAGKAPPAAEEVTRRANRLALRRATARSESSTKRRAEPGETAEMTDAVSGSTGGQLYLSQSAYGGYGGSGQYINGQSGQGGRGGDASSHLSATDSGGGSLALYASAFGGLGGTGTTGGAGG